jgi:hypothetical protein
MSVLHGKAYVLDALPIAKMNASAPETCLAQTFKSVLLFRISRSLISFLRAEAPGSTKTTGGRIARNVRLIQPTFQTKPV